MLYANLVTSTSYIDPCRQEPGEYPAKDQKGVPADTHGDSF
jgi:hypothetical protein